jgi:hypothetical protein
MAFYLRKGFRAGPFRLNLSKSGFGLSAGVTGARIGVGPRGLYTHAGRHGLYYRKHLSLPKQSRSQVKTEADGCAKVLLIIVALGLGLWFISWLIQNPIVMVIGISITVIICSYFLAAQFKRKKMVTEYKNALDATFITSQSLPSPEVLSNLEQQQKKLPRNGAAKISVGEIEADVYQALLDKVLDDGFVTDDEAAMIAAVEKVLRLDSMVRLRTKKEIFSAAYFEAIIDRKITEDEFSKLENLITGLAIPRAEVRYELGIVKEIMDAQSLSFPLDSIPSDQLAAPIQKSEKAFHQCAAKVLSRRKSKDSPSGYEHSVKRDGTMIITNKRIFIINDGTTNIRYMEIADIDVDIDDGVIEISKQGSGRPIIIQTRTPIYVGRLIDLLMSGQ